MKINKKTLTVALVLLTVITGGYLGLRWRASEQVQSESCVVPAPTRENSGTIESSAIEVCRNSR